MLKLASKGDMNAFEALILQYEKFIYNIAWRIMGNAEDAKDASQEVIIKIYNNLAACASMEHMRAWVARVTHNVCMDELRRRKGKATLSYDDTQNNDDAPQQFTDPADGPETLLLRKELAAQIEAGLKLLSDEHRALIVLRDVQGLSYEEVAQATQTPLGTVKSRLSRGRHKLKQILLKTQEQN